MEKDVWNDQVLTGNESINVSTDVLKEAADTAKKSITLMKQQMQELDEIIEATRNYWIGKASEQHRKMYNECRKEQQGIMQHLEVYPSKLLEIAGIMDDADKKGGEMAIDLPDNIFS